MLSGLPNPCTIINYLRLPSGVELIVVYILTTFTDTVCFSIYHASWLTSEPKNYFIFINCSEILKFRAPGNGNINAHSHKVLKVIKLSPESWKKRATSSNVWQSSFMDVQCFWIWKSNYRRKKRPALGLNFFSSAARRRISSRLANNPRVSQSARAKSNISSNDLM